MIVVCSFRPRWGLSRLLSCRRRVLTLKSPISTLTRSAHWTTKWRTAVLWITGPKRWRSHASDIQSTCRRQGRSAEAPMQDPPAPHRQAQLVIAEVQYDGEAAKLHMRVRDVQCVPVSLSIRGAQGGSLRRHDEHKEKPIGVRIISPSGIMLPHGYSAPRTPLGTEPDDRIDLYISQFCSIGYRLVTKTPC